MSAIGVSRRSATPPEMAALSQVPPVVAAATAVDSIIVVRSASGGRPLWAISDVPINRIELK